MFCQKLQWRGIAISRTGFRRPMGVAHYRVEIPRVCALVFLLLMASATPLVAPSDGDVVGNSADNSHSQVGSPNSPFRDIPEVYSQAVAFSPELDWWLERDSEEVRALVITRDLYSLHTWQEKYQLLPEQSGDEAGGRLVESDVESLTGIQHRIVTLPGWQVAKLAGVSGTMVVMKPPENPQTASDSGGDGFSAGIATGDGEDVIGGDDAPQPTTWAAVDLHGATGSWQRNITGQGVNVAIVDSGIDFAHPDLNGTQARVDDPTSPWDGWPIMFDGRSLHRWLDNADTYPSDGSSWFADTSTTDLDADGDGLLDSSGLNITGLVSQSGVWHLGEHPDNNLQNKVGDDVAVLVVDEVSNSTYDTVYVDLDGDGEFGDEFPMRKGSEVSGLDLTGDGLWDRSGGLIYFIADGNTSLPYAPTYSARAAMADRIPYSGDLVAFMLNENGGPAGSHGTLCASSVAAQGIVANGKVQGMAPNASLISVGNYYAGGSAFDGWRFVAEGYDGLTDSGDEAQIGSFSFGYSSVVDAGSDQNSLYLDWLTRVYSKNTTYLVALGNGGHGYGTVASPGGSAGIISVGAFSSRTGESAGATWGESASWSNRGPNSQGRMDPDLVTIGWSATGDVTLNEKSDANSAYRSWAGTSLSTPVAAGLMALLYQAWLEEHGTFPNSQVIRDLAMSTASDRANDPNVQGGGWFDADRATATIAGESGTWWTQPASWMPGENSGQHRDANINWLLPGASADLNLSFNNPSQDTYWINNNATIWEPATHDVFVWNSSESGDWDGYQSSRPDIVIPILIHGDANNTTIANDSTLVRARATIDARGFDGDQNYQSENRPYLRIYRWNDTDGDGKWWSDDDGDGHVDSGEWESANEYSIISEHMYASPQVEARIGDPWAQPADGILLGIFRENKQTSQADPLPIEIDITSFRKGHDSWMNLPPQALILPNSTNMIPLTITVPNDATPGLRMSTIEISDSFGHNWSFPIVTTIAASGPTSWTPPEIDGNLSNQTLYRETWMQGAQRWGWRAESGDWKAFALEWPTTLSNGTIIIDIDWPDNGYTDIDAHWLSRIPHPYYADDPAAYGQWAMTVETGSLSKHRGSGVWERQTATGGDRELLTADASPGLKQLLLHSTMHGVSTNDNPVNVTVGFAATISGNLTHSTDDWTRTNFSDSLVLGSTVNITPDDISGWGWTQPVFYPGETASQDIPETVSTASYIREISVENVRRLKVEIDTQNGAEDLDLYLYRDNNGNGVIDWGSEKKGSSGNWNSDEEIIIDNPGDGRWWIVVHGYEVPGAVTSFWLRLTEVGGIDLTVDDWYQLNPSEILSLCPNGCSALGGAMPTVAWRVNHTMNIPAASGMWEGYFELELPSGGGLTIPTSFDLLEKAPVLEFRGQNPVTSANSTMPLIAHVSDLQAGFNLSKVSLHGEIRVYSDSQYEPIVLRDLNPTVNATLLGGESIDLTDEFLAWDDSRARDDVTWRLPQANSNLQHWWTFDEPASIPPSTVVVDQRSDLLGDDVGLAMWQLNPERGWVMYLNTGNEIAYIDFANSPSIIQGIEVLNSDTTMSYWYNSLTNGSDDFSIAPAIAGYDSQINSDDLIFGAINSSGHVGISKGTGSPAISEVSITDGQWHHVSLSRNAQTGELRVYVDGVGSGLGIGAAGTISSVMEHIGCVTMNLNSTCLRASLDDVRIYDTVLGAADIAAIYNATKMDNSSLPMDYELRSLDISISIPDSSARLGWYEMTLSATDAADLEDEISIALAYDDDIPLYFTPFSNVFTTNQTIWEHTILGESDLYLTINGLQVIQGADASDMWMWPAQVSSTTGRAVWYNQTYSLENEGVNLFTLEAQDEAGNRRSSEIYVFRDTIAPQLSINHTYPFAMVNETVVDVIIETESGVELWVQGESVFLPTFATNLTVPVQLQQGDNLVNVTVRDDAGNWANANLSFSVDSVFPTLDWLEPPPDKVVDSYLVPLKWNLSEGTIGYISVDGGDWVSIPAQMGQSQWSVSLDLVGEHQFCLSFEDVARNIIIECRNVVLNETLYTPISTVDWDGGLSNITTLHGNLWLGPSQSWELYSMWNNQWNKVHSGISPNGGMHTVPYELREGENHFRLTAEGLGLQGEWNYSVTLDTEAPPLVILQPVDNSLFGYAGMDDLNIRIRGITESGLFVQCWESNGLISTEGFADSTGNFSLAYTRSLASEVSDGQQVAILCSTSDLAGNQVSTWLRLTFDGTAPIGELSFVGEGQQLWLRWQVSSPDELDRWVLTIEHDGGLVQSESGYFNGSTNSFSEQLDLGVVEYGNWSASFRVWDSANNLVSMNDTFIIVEPQSPLDVFSSVNLGNISMLLGVMLLITILFVLDRRRGKSDSQVEDETKSYQSEYHSGEIALEPLPLTPREAVLAAEAELELAAYGEDGVSADGGAEILLDSATVSDLFASHDLSDDEN
ncbi:MAG TPA: hypothetical protein EYN46_00420 [Candidatus Poseidoniales archaeon]|nr:hypothetical protein [Candidatus Poseidoniales archaeon]